MNVGNKKKGKMREMIDSSHTHTQIIKNTQQKKKMKKHKVASPTLIVDDVVVDGFVESRLGVADSTGLSSSSARVE